MIHRRDYLKRRDIDPEEMQLRVSYVNANVNIMMETINENQSNPKQLWKVLNKLTSKRQRDDNCVTRLHALGLSSKTNARGFDSKLLCLCSDILTHIIKKIAIVSLETNRVLND